VWHHFVTSDGGRKLTELYNVERPGTAQLRTRCGSERSRPKQAFLDYVVK
jgi:hypothetical protein